MTVRAGISTEMPTLASLIPEQGFDHPDHALDAFLAWVADSGLTLYPHQEEAILEIFAGNHVILDAPTGSGKSLVALALHFKTFAELGKTWYTAPIKALVSEKFFSLCEQFGAEHVGMLTGDGAINRDAPILCVTAEILANLALREGELARVTSVVMDEFHYYSDRDRGMAWQVPLLTLSQTRFLLMSATLGDTRVIREDLEARTQVKVSEIQGATRPVPLEYHYSTRPLHDAIADLIRSGKAPVYVVHFTQSAAGETAGALMSTDLCSKEEKRLIAQQLKGASGEGFRFHSPFGPTMRRFVSHGVGLHHAGLLPRYRLLVERLAQQGLLKVICGTDTLGVGINVPIRTVLFTQLCKFDGEKTDILKVRDFKQIAGRAGRAGFDTVGHVVAQAPAHIIENLRMDTNTTDPKKRKKMVKAQPPARGYKHWDEGTFRELIERPPEPLVSRFSVDHGRLLLLMQHAADTTGDARVGVDTLVSLIRRCHSPPAERVKIEASVSTLVHALQHAGVISEESDGVLRLDPDLPRDFSLHHSLSLFLLDALATLEPGGEGEAATGHALDVVSWVEAILENPRVILERQANRDRTARLNELKLAGVPFEERIELIESISWPKPNADRIYEVFNTYAEHHPWVAGESIRPKGVLREMIEAQVSFSDYVKDLELQRAEGVLLRYLSDAYKVLAQNVPPEHKTEALADTVAWVRAMLALVDSSLILEWEELVAGRDRPAAARGAKVDISSDKRSFYARIRAEAHAVVRALAFEDWAEAAACLRRGEDDPWGPEAFEGAMEPIQADGGVRFDHYARMGQLTTIRHLGPHQWRIRQVLLPRGEAGLPVLEPRGRSGGDDEESGDHVLGSTWSFEALVDLRDNTNPDGPLLRFEALSV